jgi:hypothetical protein
MYMYMTMYMYVCIYIYRKTELTENGNFRLFAANGNGNCKLSPVRCKRKRKTEVCFPWSANDKWYSKRDHL